MPMQNDPPDGYVWAKTLVPSLQPKEKQRVHRYEDKLSHAYDEFKYTRLKNMRNRIRLLKLKPGRYDSDAEVACELFEAEFQEDKEGVLIGVDTKEEYTYEALTWCWGTAPSDCLIVIEKPDTTRTKMGVSEELAWALMYLRQPAKSRILWIDAICIDQKSTDEKNHQVQMMAKIYSQAKHVIVWLGLDDHHSRRAITFVKDEILQLQRFDELCDDERNSQKWQALLLLMQRPWFFRRWVVQEISLAKDAMIHCGPDKIPWNDFCIAVELFVEVENATHRLSEVMKKDPKFFHLPGWFDYVSALGASLLVEATTTIFRQYQPKREEKRKEDGIKRAKTFYKPRRVPSKAKQADTSDSETVEEEPSDSDTAEENNGPRKNIPKGPPEESATLTTQLPRSLMSSRSALLNLEYLVSRLSIFETTEPRDAIYAFLAIAKDTVPQATSRPDEGTGQVSPEERKQELLAMFEEKREEKPFKVDYDKPYAEVCQDFMEFCIRNSTLPGARSHALDILCRPWAPNPSQGISENKSPRTSLHPIISREYNIAIERPFDARFVKAKTPSKIPQDMAGSHPGELKAFRERWSRALKRMEDISEDMIFPSWIPRLEGAPFVMSATPGTHIKKMSRQNANPLVGLPGNQHIYDAGQGMAVDLDALWFNRLYLQGAHCMHIRGFILSSVLEITPTSQGGQIPKQWLKTAGWEHAGDPQRDGGPPDEFWRTLVADRGVNARNPPSFYARACKESAAKGGLAGGTINTSDLIYNEQNSIVVQFCRRVQEVIWNKKLIIDNDGHLGLACENVQENDLICILYGASVPIVLRKEKKTRKRLEQERDELALFRKLEIMRNLVRKAARRRRRKRAWADKPEEEKANVRQEMAKVMAKLRLRPVNTSSDVDSETCSEQSPLQKSSTDDGINGAPATLDDVPSNEKAREPSKYYYKFMGECYIHGMMDGEAMKWKSEKDAVGQKIKDHIFELR